MRKLNKIFSFIMIWTIMVSMAGCAKESTKKKESLSVPENNKSSVETADKNTKMDTRYRLNKIEGQYGRLHDIKEIGDSVYIAGNEYFSGNTKEIISVIDIENKEEKLIKEYDESKMLGDSEIKSMQEYIYDGIYRVYKTDKGMRIVKIDLSSGQTEVVFQTEQDMEIQYFGVCNDRKYICQVGVNGKIVDVYDTNFNHIGALEFDSGAIISKLFCDDMNNTYVFIHNESNRENVLYKYDIEFNKIYHYIYSDMNGYPFAMFKETYSDNNVIATIDDESNIFINVIDAQTGETLDRYEFSDNELCNIYSGAMGYEMLLMCGDGIYGYNYSTDQKELLYGYDYENIPYGLTSDSDMIKINYVSDTEEITEGIKVIDSQGSVINKIPYIKNIDGFISSAYITEDGGVCYIEEEYNPAYMDDNMGGHIIHYIAPDGNHSYYNVPAENTENYPLFVTADSNKNVFIGERGADGFELVVSIYDISGNLIKKLNKNDFHGLNFYFMKNGELCLSLSERNEENNLYSLNCSSDKYALLKENFGGGVACTGDNDNDIYITLSGSIYKYSFETEEFTKMFSMEETGDISAINGNIEKMSYIGDDEFIVSMRTEEGLSCYKFEKYQTEAVQTITVGAFYFDDTMMEHITNFNDDNKDVRIVTKSYAGVELINQMHIDLIENKLDMIISDDNLSIDDYSADMFCDLSDFFEKDEDIIKTDYYENIVELYNEEGSMHKISPSFQISALVGRAEDMTQNQGNGWSEEEFLAFADNHNIFDKMNYTFFMRTFIPYFSDNYIDRQNYTCNFVNSQFKNIISTIKDDIGNLGNEFSDCYSLADHSTDLIMEDIDEYSSAYSMFNNTDIVFKGYPSKDKNGFIVNPDICFSITANCENKEKAWEFIKYFLLDEYQSSITNSIPLKKKYVDYIFGSSGQMSSDKLRNEIMEVIENADILNRTNSGSRIYKILEEELALYFDSQLDLDQVAESIQSKVSLYLNEIK